MASSVDGAGGVSRFARNTEPAPHCGDGAGCPFAMMAGVTLSQSNDHRAAQTSSPKQTSVSGATDHVDLAADGNK